MPYADPELYSLILGNMAEGVILVRTSDLAIVYANPRFEHIFGYDPGELDGQPVWILNHADDVPAAIAVARTIAGELERRGEADFEVHNRKKDGTPIWCRARASGFEHPRYGPVWVVVQGDITAEKEATERLRRQEKLLSSVFEALPVGLWLTDGEGRLVRTNSAGKRMWGDGTDAGEQPPRCEGWWAHTGEPIAADAWAQARAVRRGETAVGELVRVRCRDGRQRTLLNSATPLREGESIVGAIVVHEDVTHLTEAEALASGVVAAAPDAIVATDGERRIVVFNAGAERIFGHSREELLGRDIGILVAEQHRDALEVLLDAATTGETTEPCPLTGRRRSGEAFPAEVSAACTQVGLLRRYTLVLRDITARVRAEDERAALARALAEERSWLRALIATAPVGIATLDGDARLILNARAEELLGASPVDRGPDPFVGLVRRPDETPLPPDQLPLSRAVRGESALSEEYLLVRPDGTRRWVLGAAAPVTDRNGRRIGAVGTLEDITTQKHLEADLGFLAEAGRTLVESLDLETTLRKLARLPVPYLADACVIYLGDEGGDVAPVAAYCQDPELTRAAEEVLRRYPVRRSARGADAVIRTGQPEFVAAVSSEDWRHLSQRPECRELLRRTGLRSFLTVPLRAREETIGAMSLFDLGAARTVGKLDLALSDVLGRRAGLAIDNARLYRAAQRASKARDDVLAVVAHDIRNPLSAIVVAVNTVLLGLPAGDAKAHRAAEVIKRAAVQINRLIDDLLDVARIDAGTLALDPAPLAPGELVTEAVEAARPWIAELELSATVEPGLPEVSADRHRLLQVLSNLLGNAAKFTPPGGRIDVHAERRHGEVVISVRDNGRGIAADELEHIFDRFWQADRTDRRGAGLGLAIVKGIIEAHGGKVWVESRSGAGATCRFSLPLDHP